MPIFMFDRDRMTVIFYSAFEADMHECKFSPRQWERVRIGRSDEDNSKRGNAFTTSTCDPLSAYYSVARYFS